MTEEKPKIALITGITGQDGSYLAEFLLEKGYIVSHYFCSLFSLGWSFVKHTLAQLLLSFRRFMALSVVPRALILVVSITSTETAMRLE
jgi:GDPmannose 4,6-dehydratase